MEGSVLTMSVIESVGIAVDHAFGHAADPTSSVASTALAPVFAMLAAIGWCRSSSTSGIPGGP
jgi:hypothetical protein